MQTNFEPTTIAMWSGPRNLSTAMLRSWENRADTVVIDEPFYAHYLQATNAPHPMAQAIIDQYETDWRTVANSLATPAATGIYYQKHITTHMLPQIELDWLRGLKHVFLIRDPRRVVASFSEKYADTSEQDLGYTRQQELFDHVCQVQGATPVVIDAMRFLQNPRTQLTDLCHTLGIPFSERMLSWPAGERSTDGIWHAHWYDAVKRSTSFQAPPTTLPKLNDWQTRIASDCMPCYEHMLSAAA